MRRADRKNAAGNFLKNLLKNLRRNIARRTEKLRLLLPADYRDKPKGYEKEWGKFAYHVRLPYFCKQQKTSKLGEN